MLNFNEQDKAPLGQMDQLIATTIIEHTKAAQLRALLITLRSAVDGEGYDLEKVARNVVKAFDELEGAGC